MLIGNMSFVGPRPDVPGYADKLEGDPSTGSGQAVWCCPSTSLRNQLRPGITGPATLKYRLEDEMLASLRLSLLKERVLPTGKERCMTYQSHSL